MYWSGVQSTGAEIRKYFTGYTFSMTTLRIDLWPCQR